MIPHQAGTVPMPIMVDEATFKFRMIIAGDRNYNGDRYDNPVAGYLSNYATLRAALDVPDVLASPGSTIDVTWTVPGYGDLGATCQFMLDATAELKIGTTLIDGTFGAMKRAVLTVRCTDGYFS